MESVSVERGQLEVGRSSLVLGTRGCQRVYVTSYLACHYYRTYIVDTDHQKHHQNSLTIA